MPTVIGEINGKSQEKRFYLPGLKIEDQCPDCKQTLHWESPKDYLSYPIFGDKGTVDFHFYCQDCDKEWDVQGSLSITIKL